MGERITVKSKSLVQKDQSNLKKSKYQKKLFQKTPVLLAIAKKDYFVLPKGKKFLVPFLSLVQCLFMNNFKDFLWQTCF